MPDGGESGVAIDWLDDPAAAAERAARERRPILIDVWRET